MMTKALTTQEFIDKAQKLYGNHYDYSRVVYVSSKEKIKLTCKSGHRYQQQAGKHIHGSGCPKCSHAQSKKTGDNWRYN